MSLLKSFLSLTLGTSIVLAQTSEAPRPKASDEVKKVLLEARKMRLEHRYSEALEKLDEAEKLAPNLADIYALRGDIYLAPRRRDFDLALPQFQKAAELEPQSPLPRFNLAEYFFVKHEFDAALQAFTKITADFPKLPMIIRHLVHYKRALCELKLGHRPAAEQIVADNFTFMDDTPAYYFSKAALAFDLGDAAKANEWVQRGVAVFKGPNCEPYYDAFKELRWVPDMDLNPSKDQPKKP
ncbi:MAG: tetratricopeptide repeat protein [Prosthecobacter sp.]|jgi:tetratricopeptide (TPR) repeat protein|uniref:tetratricopeptide repeat protein n=1 Tax=Prosthecobacter sp. TaxID=1965333 RepID=UPI0019E1AEED|nr:tetratricopeptide repeat protein [Prosthecobacter sp.]MBE2287174.1 tetratricopeptide repeat protein [Prosthecobacter sp.]